MALTKREQRNVDWKPRPEEEVRRSSVSLRLSTWGRLDRALEELRAEPGYRRWTRDMLLDHLAGVALDARDAQKERTRGKK